MKCKEISIQFLNRIVGIVVWVALWNLLDLTIPNDNVMINVIITVIGLVIWGFLGEYTITQQRAYAGLSPVV